MSLAWLVSLTAISLFTCAESATAAITFRQVNAAVPQTPQATVSVTYTAAQTAGNLNVVAVGWSDSTAVVNSVTDTKGNVYTRAVGPTVQAGVATQSIYYARSIVAAAASANIVTVRFSVAANYPDIRILEYSGLDTTNPVDVTAAATGTSASSITPSVTTTNANDLIFGANLVQTSTSGPGTGFTSRVITNPDGDIAEDRIVTTAGSYSAIASLNSAGQWIMQMVAFRAASTATTPDLTITKTHAGDFTQGQTGATYTLTATNSGTAPTTGAVTVTDTLPTGLTATGFTGTGWTCALTPTPSCTRSDVLAAAVSYPSLTLTVTVAGNAPATVTNTATVAGGGETNTANDTANDVTAITGAPLATITFRQVNAAVPQTPQATVSVTYTAAQTAGNLNVVVVGWSDSTAVVNSVTDTKGNVYTRAVGPTVQAGVATQSIYYARSIVAAAAGANIVTVRFSVAANYPDIRILEYSGLDNTNPVDVTAAATGTSASSITPSVTTTNADDLIFGANLVQTSTGGPGTGFTSRVITIPDGDIAEDRIVTTAGSYSAIASLNSAGQWIMQMVAFKAAAGGADTIPPTTPSDLTATAASSSQANLTWTASTDNVGVMGYRVERCQGASCTTFAQIATSTGSTYNDSGLATYTTYSYRVRAADAAGNLSPYSNVAIVTTLNSSSIETFNDPGFTSELIVTLPPFTLVGLKWSSDGRIFVWQKNGMVRIIKNGILLPTPFLDFTSKVNSYDDRGMWGLAFDPDFANNGYVYLTYVYEEGGMPNDTNPKTSRLTRVKADPANPDVMLPGSEVFVLGSISIPPCNLYPPGSDCIPADSGSHSIGTLQFAPDDKLFVGIGDGADAAFVDPNSLRAQDIDSWSGKILRINPDGTAPGDNPFDDGTNSIRSKVWLFGVRNPFRFALHPTTQEPYFGDVGWDTWEEVDRGSRGGNFGWPCYEGDDPQPQYQSQFPLCSQLSPTAVLPPLYTYNHSTGSTAVIGGPFYSGSQYPEAYQGSLFFADYTGNWIRRMVLDNTGAPINVLDFATNVPAPVTVEQGPDGFLYYLSFTTGQIRRIRYNGPSAVASATPLYGYSPLAVSFTSAGSTAPGGGSLTYLWDFGDGATSTVPNPSHTYVAIGAKTFTATLTVTSNTNLASSASMFITVGSLPPTPSIQSPPDGMGVYPGQVVTYQGTATDPDDGVLDPGSLNWTVLLHHNSHVHTFVGGTGYQGSFVAENHGAIGTFSYEILLTATDSSGLTATSNVLLPVLADTSPPTAPSDLTATAAGSGQINLTWTAASDNAAVQGYRVERCQGLDCGIFSEIATSSGTTYNDSGLTESTTYSYRVRATDASGNLGPYSFTASTTTQTGSPPPVSFVQANYAIPQTPQAIVSVNFPAAQTAGNLNVLIVGWNDSTAVVNSVTDSKGNQYTRAVGPTVLPGAVSQSIYYARNIVAAVANSNTVTVQFSTPANYPDIRILEYSGLDPANPVDVTAASTGTSASSTTPLVTTTNANDLLVVANTVQTSTTGPGAGFTLRIITNPDGDIVEDRAVTTLGSYTATAPLSSSGYWVMQLVAFK